MMPAEATQKDIAVVRNALGLDRPWPVQYWRFVEGAAHGDFGRSVRFRRPAMDLILERYRTLLKQGALLVAEADAVPSFVHRAQPGWITT